MAKLSWDDASQKIYKNGLDKGVLFVRKADGTYDFGVPWYGLTGLTESPSGGEITRLYANNTEYGSIVSREEFGGTIEAYYSPPKFDECDGTAELDTGVKVRQQTRKSFALAYRSLLHSDANPDLGYEIHLVYGCRITPSEVARATVGETEEADTMSWEFKSTPVEVAGLKPTAHIVISSVEADPALLAYVEDSIYGTDTPDAEPFIPMPADLITQINL